MARIGMLALAVMVAAIAAPFASASQLIDRNAVGVKLTVNAKGEALLTYRKGGKVMRVLAWGAVDAVSPTDDAPQTELKLDYAGGWGKYYANDPAIKNAAGQVPAAQAQRPALSRPRPPSSSSRPSRRSRATTRRSRSAARARSTPARRSRGSSPRARRPTAATGPCRAGSARCRTTASTPNATQSVWELRLSHWTTDLPQLTIQMDWSWHKWDHLFGTYTYRGRPGLRLRLDPDRPAARRLRPQPLRRHARLGVRRGVEAREQLPHAQPDGRLLLQRQPARRAPGRERREVPRHDPGPGRDARRDVGGRAARRVRQGAGRDAERGDRPTERQALPSQLGDGGSSAARGRSTSCRGTAHAASHRAIRWLAGSGASVASKRVEELEPRDLGLEQRELFRRWPAGVSVVVAESGGRRAGLTVSSLISLSLDPPLVAISLAQVASLYEVLQEAGEWTASILVRRAGRARAALRAQRAAARALGRHPGARGRPAPDRGRGRLAARAHDRRGARRRPHAVRRRGARPRARPREHVARLHGPASTSSL